MRCNLDRNGRLLRLVSGLILLAVGAAMIIGWAYLHGGRRAWSASAGVAAFGLFQVYEAWSGGGGMVHRAGDGV